LSQVESSKNLRRKRKNSSCLIINYHINGYYPHT
jgi:hypothetical protein